MADSTDLFAQDVEAILLEAPDYETGLDWLQEYYTKSEWDDPEKALEILQTGAVRLGSQKGQSNYFDYEETKNNFTPISLDEIDEEDPIKKINKWEEENTKLVESATDPYAQMLKPKWLASIHRAAISERSLLRGGPTLDQKEALEEGVYSGESFPVEYGRRAIGGAVGGLLDLAGFEEAETKLQAADPGVGTLRSVGADIAGGVGFMGGLAASSFAGATLAGPLAPYGAAIGAGGFILANAASAIRKTFETGIRETGSTVKATDAALAETGSQVIQAAIGGQAAVSLVKRSLGKTLRPITRELGAAAGVGAGTGLVGGALSATAQGIATDTLSPEQILEGAGRGFVTGGVIGPAAVPVGIKTGNFIQKRVDRYNKPSVTLAAEPETGRIPTQPDGTFKVSEETASKILALQNARDVEGNRVKVYINPQGKLVAKNPYLSRDLTLRKPEVLDQVPDLGEIEIPVNDGSVLLDAMRPRANDTSGTDYTKATARSAGAASIEELTKERGRASRLRTDPTLSESLRNRFGDPDGPGLLRYYERPNRDLVTATDERIANLGEAQAIAEFLSTDTVPLDDEGLANLVDLGEALIQRTDQASDRARQEGRLEDADALQDLSEDIGYKLAGIGTFSGKGQQAFQARNRLAKNVVDGVKGRIRKTVNEEIAVEEKLTPEEVAKTEGDLALAEEALKELNAKENPEVVEADTLVADIEKDISDIETKQKENQQEEQDQIRAEIEDYRGQIKKLELEQTAKEQEFLAAQEEAKAELEAKKLEIDAAKEALKQEVEKAKKALQQERNRRLVETRDLRKALNKATEEGKPTKALEKKIQKLEAEEQQRGELDVNEENLDTPKAKEARVKIKKAEDRVKVIKDVQARAATKKPTPNIEKKTKLEKLILDLEKEARDKAADPKRGLGARDSTTLGKRRTQLEAAKKRRDSLKSKADSEDNEARKALNKRVQVLKDRKKKIRETVRERLDKALPPEKQKRLKDLEAAISRVGSEREKVALETQIYKIRYEAEKTHVGKLRSLNNRLQTYYAANLLFRVGTQAANIIGNLGQVALNTVAYSVPLRKGDSVLDGVRYLVDFASEVTPKKLGGKGTALTEGARVLLEGKEAYQTRLTAEQGGVFGVGPSKLEVDKVRTRDFPDPAEVVPILGYSLRALSAADAVFTRAGYEAEAHLIARQQLKREGTAPENFRTKLAEKLFNSETDWKNARKQAEQDAAILKEVGIKRSERDILANTWAIMDAKRNADLRANAAYAAGLSFLNTDVNPRGTIGFISTGIANVATRSKVGPYLAPFLNTTLKLANLTIDPTPVGFVKAAKGAYQGEAQNVVRRQFGSALIGSTVMAGLYSILKSQDDEQNPFFDLIGPAPKERGARDAFYQSGRKPWSIKLGSNYFSFVYTPLVGPLGAIAALNHRRKTDKNFDESTNFSAAGTLLAGSFKAFGDLAVLRNVSNLFEAAQSGEDPGDKVFNYLVSTARGFIPGVAVLEEVERAFENPTSTVNTFNARMFRNTPFAEMSGGRPSLNVFGEPIKRDWYERMPGISSTMNRFYSTEKEDENILWLANNGYLNALASIEPKITIKDDAGKYELTKEARENRLGAVYDDTLTETERQLLTLRAGPQFKEMVNSYRLSYGNHKHNPEVEKELQGKLSKIKHDTLYSIFIEGSYKSQEEMQKEVEKLFNERYGN